MKQDEIKVWEDKLDKLIQDELQKNTSLHAFLKKEGKDSEFCEAVSYATKHLVKTKIHNHVQAEGHIKKYMALPDKKLSMNPIYFLVDYNLAVKGFGYWDQIEVAYLMSGGV